MDVEYSKFENIEDLKNFIITNQELLNAFDANVTTEGECIAYVAIRNRLPIGFIVADKYQRPNLYIEFVVVDANSQKKGIGSSLLAKMEKYAKRKRFETLSLIVDQYLNESALKLYQKIGFTIAEDDDRSDTYVSMTKTLQIN